MYIYMTYVCTCLHPTHTVHEIIANAQRVSTADFHAQGMPYRELDEGVRAALATIAQQRLFGLGWAQQAYDWVE